MSRARLRRCRCRAVLRHPPQHGVDQAGIARRAAVGLREPHRRGRRRHGRARRARGSARRRSAGWFRRAARRRESPCRESRRAECRSVPSRRSTVAASRRISARSRSGERGQARDGRPCRTAARRARAAPAQHAVEDVGGDPAGGEARDFRLGGGARTRHEAILAANCGPVAKETTKPSTLHSFRQEPLAGRGMIGQRN